MAIGVSFSTGMTFTFALTVLTFLISDNFAEDGKISLSLTSSCSLAVLNQTCTIVCNVSHAAGVVGEVEFFHKTDNELNATVGKLEQSKSGCSVVVGPQEGYRTECGMGTDEVNSDTSVYSMVILRLARHDATDWWCTMAGVNSNTVSLGLPVNGQWSSWKNTVSGLCSGFCTRRVVLTRTCSNSPPSQGGLPCEGNDTRNNTETCTGDNCGK
ncbi:uncharacterized protein LOC121385901 [Gigantopelta aegis]|uniref:uncharacterized protein LOC121385901 n=1 Tax=Gigantopelta aegis TaxID=1735272 RepID=UPI001B888ADC|nr:uncharacterized protein LOC121385901 [Gigantopelta aegis]